MLSYYHKGLDVLGASGLDPAVVAFRDKTTAIAPVTVAVARNLLKGGLDSINKTIEIIKDQGSKTLVPLERAQDYKSHLDWHKTEIEQQAAGKNPNAVAYANADDLKHYVINSFTELTTVSNEKALQERISSEMWSDIGKSLSEQALSAAKSVQSVASAATTGVSATISHVNWIIYGLLGAVVIGGSVYLVKTIKPFAKALRF